MLHICMTLTFGISCSAGEIKGLVNFFTPKYQEQAELFTAVAGEMLGAASYVQ